MNFSILQRSAKIASVILFAFSPKNTASILEITSLHEVAAYLIAAQAKVEASEAEETKWLREFTYGIPSGAAAEVEVGTIKPLCALDLDFTVSRPTHPATDPANFHKYAKLFMKRITEEGLNPVEVMFATTLTEQQLMEPNAKEAILTLNRLATVIGLTARFAGEFAGVDMEEHTAAMLESFDTSFEESMEKITFDEMPAHRGYKPVFNKGILFCNGERGAPVTKPEVLAAYIKTCGQRFEKIIVVDDTRKHLEDCEAYFADIPDVEFQLFHYVRAVREEQRDCTEEEFLVYLERLINILKPTTVEE